jgi:large subunit ribosomal protein L28
MANICSICGKKPQTANLVSNANNKRIRWIYPNVHVIRFTLKGQNKVHRAAVCTKCVKAKKVEKIV